MHALSPSEHRDLGMRERNQLSKGRHLASLSLPIPDENHVKYTVLRYFFDNVNRIYFHNLMIFCSEVHPLLIRRLLYSESNIQIPKIKYFENLNSLILIDVEIKFQVFI